MRSFGWSPARSEQTTAHTMLEYPVAEYKESNSDKQGLQGEGKDDPETLTDMALG